MLHACKCFSLCLFVLHCLYGYRESAERNTSREGIHRLKGSHRFESRTVILTKLIRDENKGYLVDSASAFSISKSITVSG